MKKEKRLNGMKIWLLIGFIPLVVLLVLGTLWIQLSIRNREMVSLMRYCTKNRKLNIDATEIVLGEKACDCHRDMVLDFSKFSKLKRLKIGNNNLQNAKDVQLVGLKELESVEIGNDSFGSGNGAFQLKECPKLKELVIGDESFVCYSGIEIENVDALEVIRFGELNSQSYNFKYASLELKSILIHKE